MRVDNIGRTSPPEQLTYPLAVVLAQWFDADTRQHAREIGLRAAIAPDPTNNRRTRPQRRALPLEHAQLGARHTIRRSIATSAPASSTAFTQHPNEEPGQAGMRLRRAQPR